MKLTEKQYAKLERFGFGELIPMIKENEELRKELPVILGERTGYKLRAKELEGKIKELENLYNITKKFADHYKLESKALKEELDSKNLHKTITQPYKSDNRWILDASIDIDMIDENQKIVDNLKLHYRNSHPTDYDLRSFVEEIIKEATGKDIKDLASKEKK